MALRFKCCLDAVPATIYNTPTLTTDAAKPKSFWSQIGVSLTYRDFRLLWVGSLTEHFAEFIEIAAILWLTYELTHSPLWLTVVGGLRSIPMVVFSILGGVVVDRMDRRAVLVYSLVASGALSVVMTILVATGLIALWHIVVISIVGAIAQSFNHPARQAIVPGLVSRDHLLNALSLDNISVHASRLMGMPLAGYGIAAFGVTSLFGIRAVGCLVTIIILLNTHVPALDPTARGKSPWRDLREGMSYAGGSSLILILMLLYLVPMFTNNSYINFLPVFANEILNVGASGYGFLQAAPGLGAVLSVIAVAAFSARMRKGRLLFLSGVALGVCLLGFALSRLAAVSLLMLVLIGATATTFMIVNNTLVQASLPDRIRGRVMSLREVAMGLGPAGGILLGYLAQVTTVPATLVGLGVILVITCSLSLAFMTVITRQK